jgi:hypothetical protein
MLPPLGWQGIFSGLKISQVFSSGWEAIFLELVACEARVNFFFISQQWKWSCLKMRNWKT